VDMSFALFMDGDMGEHTGKLVTFIINTFSLSVCFILIPLLPMPLPYIVAFLVAYATYKDKPYGMITGSLLVSLGLIYHLSRIGFFNIFPNPILKIVLLTALIAPFVVCPALVTNNLHIIAIDMGMIAASLLFFTESFYLAIPLILVFATIYKGRGIVFTFIYYAFISLPLQLIQYLKTFQEGVFPPLYTPLNIIYRDIQSSMSYVSLEEIKRVFGSIGEIFLSQGFERYVDEVPDYITDSFSIYLSSDYVDYITSATPPNPSAPRYIIEAFMQFVHSNIPAYENSNLARYINSTLPTFITQNLSPSISRSLRTAAPDALRVEAERLFPEYVNTVFQEYFKAALGQFLNSVPGIILFLVIMIGFISAITLLNMNMPDPVQESIIPGKYVNFVIYLLPIFVAAMTNLIFFLSIDRLQLPLAFQASVSEPILLNSTLFTVLFSTPVSFSKYLSDLREVKKIRSATLVKECDSQQRKVEHFLQLITRMRNPMPDDFIDLRTRMLIALDELKEIRANTEGAKDLKEIDENIRRIYNGLKEEVESFETRLDVALRDYYIKMRFKYLEAVGEIKDLGIDIEAPVLKDMSADASLEEKLEHIEEILEAGRLLVENLIDTCDKIYEIISSLFEPTLPKDSATLLISREKLDEDEPWVIIDAILVSLKNWEKQYSADILKATRPINESIQTIIELGNRRSSLRGLLGDKYYEIKDLAEKVKLRNFSDGEENLKVLKVILIRDTILNIVDVVGKIIGILYYHIKDLEFNINLLLPREDYEWNRNLTLTERMSQSLEVINNYEQYRIDELISHLYRVLSYIDEALDTIEYYNERKEMLLNYPLFKKKIDRILEEKGEMRLDELGVSEKYGREYLKIYHRTTHSPLLLEETANSLRRKA